MNVDQVKGDPLSGAANAELSQLSDTERRIVALVAAGRTNAEVGERLFLSPRTVEWSLTKIYRQLRVRSRTELAAKLAARIAYHERSGENPRRMQDEHRVGSPSPGSS